MIKTDNSEQQIEKIIDWIEQDIDKRYPLIGERLLKAAAELEVNNNLMFIANRRISFGIHKLVAKPMKQVKTTEDDVVITIEDKKITKKITK